MYNQDYLMRMVEEFASAIARIIFLRQTGNTAEALDLIEHCTTESLGLSMSDLELLSAQEIHQHCLAKDQGIERAVMEVSQLLMEHARLTGHTSHASKALSLATIHINSVDSLHRDIYDILWNGCDLWPKNGILETCQVLRRLKEYERLEDLYFHLMDKHPEDFEPQLKDFLNQLLLLDDTALISHGLPRHEIIQDLAYLENLCKSST